MPTESVVSNTPPVFRASRTFAVVLNQSAGALVGGPDVAEAIRAASAEHGLTPKFIPAEAGDLPARVTLARDSGAAAVVVVGGDGTVACAAQVLADTGTPLGILPSGTMNLLARDLAIPIGDLAAGVRVLAEGTPRAIDVGEVNGRVFLCGSMLGLPTRLAQYREAGRGEPVLRLWVRFLGAALRIFFQYRPLALMVSVDGRTRHVRTSSLTVTVNALSDSTGRQFGRACLDGGILAVYIFNRLRLVDALRVGASAMLGRWRKDPVIDVLLGAEISVTGRRPALPVMNDGEVGLLKAPLHYRIRPRALLVIAPAVTASEPW
jgi:diacylglycerol kinase family enzyme